MLKVQREFLVILDCWEKIWFCIIFLAKLVLKVHLHMQVQNDNVIITLLTCMILTCKHIHKLNENSIAYLYCQM